MAKHHQKKSLVCTNYISVECIKARTYSHTARLSFHIDGISSRFSSHSHALNVCCQLLIDGDSNKMSLA
jgi:hypothetical protein